MNVVVLFICLYVCISRVIVVTFTFHTLLLFLFLLSFFLMLVWRIVFAVLYFCPFFVCFVVVVAGGGGGSGDDGDDGDDVVDDDDIVVVVVVVVEFLSGSRTYVQHDWPVFIRCYIMA